ncbi:MAG: hypothetical protein N3A60_11685, partial [Thermanaerothrix sp.]|nr:hypothetical protein [Thermanaerothrix sp.]
MMGARCIFGPFVLIGWLTLVTAGCTRTAPNPSPPPCGEDRVVLGDLTLTLRPWPAENTGLNDLP